MAGKKGVIETGVDKLLKLVRERKKISTKDASKELGSSVAGIEEWAEFLEEAGLITIQTKFTTVYLLERQMSDKELAIKLKDMKEEKESFVRHMESSLNRLDGDRDEIKMVDSEFKKIRGIIEKNFDILNKKLAKLDDFRKSTGEISAKELEIERTYDKKVGVIESELKKEEQAHRVILQQTEDAQIKLKADSEKLDSLHIAQKELQTKVYEAQKLLAKFNAEIDKENKVLSEDELQVQIAKKSSDKLKDEIHSSSNSIKTVELELKKSRAEFQKLGSEFKNDLELLRKGDFHKISAYKESKEIMDRFDKFLSKSKEIEDSVKVAEKSEAELRKRYDSISKKLQTLRVITSSDELKRKLDDLSGNLDEIDTERGILSGKMRKLRLFMRSVGK